MKLTESDLTNFDLYRSDNIEPKLKSAMALTALDILNKLPCEKKRPRNGQKPAKDADMNKFYLRDKYFRRPGINDAENEADEIKVCDRTLLRDLTNTTIQHGPYGLYVTGGDLHCLYTGRDISFRPKDGAKISSVIEVDHVVPLEDVWRSDRGLSPQARHELFGNELEVQAVTKIVNRKKGAGAFDKWPIMRRQDSKCNSNSNSNNYKPKKFNKLYLAQYAVRQVVIKDLYGLRVSPEEHDSLEKVLTRAAKQA